MKQKTLLLLCSLLLLLGRSACKSIPTDTAAERTSKTEEPTKTEEPVPPEETTNPEEVIELPQIAF